MKKSPYINLIVFYTSYLLFGSFGTSILPTYFLERGLTLNQMMMGKIIFFIGNLLLLLLLRSMKAKISWKLALISTITYILLVINLKSVVPFYLGMFISGMSLYFFYVFYNIAHFELTPKEKTGGSSALMFNLPSMIGLFIPLLAGYLAHFNIVFIWVISIFLFVYSYYLINRQSEFKVAYSIKESLEVIKSTRIFILLEGLWEALPFGIIPIYTLIYIKEPLSFGAYLSYLALISILANLVLGRLTDKVQKRSIFLYPITILMALTTFLFPLATDNIVVWVILTSFIQFLLPVFWNISTAFVVDANSDLKKAIPGREIVLATGRLIGLVLAFLSFTFENKPKYIFIILGMFMVMYPLILYFRTKIVKSHSYL